jgi:hypothetical protein
MIPIEMWYKSKYDTNQNKMLKYDINQSMIKIWYKSKYCTKSKYGKVWYNKI